MIMNREHREYSIGFHGSIKHAHSPGYSIHQHEEDKTRGLESHSQCQCGQAVKTPHKVEKRKAMRKGDPWRIIPYNRLLERQFHSLRRNCDAPVECQQLDGFTPLIRDVDIRKTNQNGNSEDKQCQQGKMLQQRRSSAQSSTLFCSL